MNHFFSLRLLAFGLLCTVCLSATASSPAVVAGRISNIPPDGGKVASVIFCDPFNESGDRVAVRLADDGTFRAVYPTMRTAQNITINYADRFINLFVAPGDSVFVDLDASNFNLGFSGSNAVFNTALAPLCDYLYRIPFTPPNDTLAPKPYLDQVRRTVGVLHDSIARYAARHNTPKEVVQWAERDAVYLLANSILDYRLRDPEARWSVFSDPIFGLGDPTNFRSMLFRYHLEVTLRTLMQKQVATHQAQWDTLAAADQFQKGIEWTVAALRTRPPSLVRDYMFYEMIEKNRNVVPDAINHLSVADFTDPSIYAALQPQAEREHPTVVLNGVSHLNGSAIEAVPQGDLLAQLAQKYPNKVLYIDVYATWCGPCIAEFKVSGVLHELFEGKEVVFVNLCLSSPHDKWLPTIDRMAIQGEHYFLPADATKLFMSAHEVSGFPTYMVVDRQGKLVTNKAPRPSQTVTTAELLDKLLK